MTNNNSRYLKNRAEFKVYHYFAYIHKRIFQNLRDWGPGANTVPYWQDLEWFRLHIEAAKLRLITACLKTCQQQSSRVTFALYQGQSNLYLIDTFFNVWQSRSADCSYFNFQIECLWWSKNSLTNWLYTVNSLKTWSAQLSRWKVMYELIQWIWGLTNCIYNKDYSLSSRTNMRLY